MWCGITIGGWRQPKPDGLAQAFHIGRIFVGKQPAVSVIGDNIIDGAGFQQLLASTRDKGCGATIFAYEVADARRYSNVELDREGRVLNLQVKLTNPKLNFAMVGLYFYDSQVVASAKRIRPSSRGTLEVTI